MNRNDELYHHGIKGMKWGHRKAAPMTSIDRARANYKSAKKAYNRSFSKASKKALSAYSPSKKQRKANDARWDRAINDVKKMNKAKSVYKAEKKVFNSDVKQYQKNQGLYDLSINKNGTVTAISKASMVKDSISAKKGKAYADKVAKTANRRNAREFIVGYATTGAAIAATMHYLNN